ncbi:hypothetical protein [Pedobacter steynii]
MLSKNPSKITSNQCGIFVLEEKIGIIKNIKTMDATIIVAIITALATIIVAIITVSKQKKKDEILEEEFEEIVNIDGSSTKREKRRYK